VSSRGLPRAKKSWYFEARPTADLEEPAVIAAPHRPRLRSSVALLLAAAALHAAPALAGGAPVPAGDPASGGEPLLGVDVSHHSGAIDWEQVIAAGYDFAYVKASEGVDAPDPRFAEHWRKLGELGVPRGAYHFYVTEDDPDEQARLFLATVDLRPGDLLPVVDVELIGHGTQPGLADRLRRFLDLVEAEAGVRPMIYTGPNFWDAHVGPGFGEHPLWVAEYGVAAPRLPSDWQGWHLWQYRENQTVPGIEKDVDLNRVHPEVGLAALIIPAPAP
jgi:lysozyme